MPELFGLYVFVCRLKCGLRGKKKPPGLPGDANLDGVVSADDYGSVQANFGNTAGMGGVSVPEPATLALLCIGAAAMFRRKKRG